MHILYKFATRSRPEKFKATVEKILFLSKHLYFTILVSIDIDDPTAGEVIAYKQILCDVYTGMNNITTVLGTSKNKIDAINRDMDVIPDWDIIVNVSDDMVFLKEGFDLDIIEAFGGNLDQFIHFPDGHTGEKLASMSIIGSEYYDRFGYIYHPDYVSLWCDNEAMEVAQQLNKYKYVDKQIFEHRHPAWVGGPVDAQLAHTQKFERQDHRTYLKRKSLGFPKESIY